MLIGDNQFVYLQTLHRVNGVVRICRVGIESRSKGGKYLFIYADVETNQIARMAVRILPYGLPHTDRSISTGKSSDRIVFFKNQEVNIPKNYENDWKNSFQEKSQNFLKGNFQRILGEFLDNSRKN